MQNSSKLSLPCWNLKYLYTTEGADGKDLTCSERLTIYSGVTNDFWVLTIEWKISDLAPGMELIWDLIRSSFASD